MPRFAIRRILAAFAALLMPVGAAHAVVYSSNFDPLDFFGSATFDVAPSCLTMGTGFVSNNGDPCTVVWLTATVTLTGDTGSTEFSYHPTHLPSESAVTNIYVEEGQLIGVNSLPIGPMIVAGHPDASLNGPWWIEYSFDATSELITAQDGEFGFGIVLLYTGSCVLGDFEQLICTRNDAPVAIAQVLDFTRVPEPATLALLLLAAAGGWSSARRSRRRA